MGSTNPPTRATAQDYVQAATDPAYFIERHVLDYQTHPVYQTSVGLPLSRNQRQMLLDMQCDKWNTFIKYRQQGGTLLVLGYLAHRLCFTPGFRAIVVAGTLSRASELVDQLRRLIEQLPAHLSPGLVKPGTRVRHLELGNGAFVQGLNVSREGIRGFGPDFVFVDEFCWTEHFEAFYPSMQGALSCGAQLVLLSSPGQHELPTLRAYLKFPQLSAMRVRALKWFEDDLRARLGNQLVTEGLRWEKTLSDGRLHVYHGPQPNQGQLLHAGYQPRSAWTDARVKTYYRAEHFNQHLAQAYYTLLPPGEQLGCDPFSFQYLDERVDAKSYFHCR